ncbi:hypothetical protein PR202_ga22158 [Eleusine coracana subsp. coracana]|uniref:Uncharacterized protein n=1 Tax=Eleusine coracana subsp. coracana TaxID=191504 RepID=A0AAV5D2A7_ELECO|nr:hypothetical protein PR202_ga22158 [Eleusine coracana subsp. coracana]
MINKDKPSILFSKSIKQNKKNTIKHALQVHSETVNEKYLGLPVYIGQSKKEAFQYIKEKIWNRIQGWKERLLYKAGKAVSFKAVAQAIPTFAMSCFDLTKTFCDEVSTMICRYWWSQQEKDKMHWVTWEKMLQPKADGGLGFRDLHHFNLAMLAKQVWRLIQNPSSLCDRILKARYFPTSDILNAGVVQGCSYTWRSIVNDIELMKKGMIWRVGDGESINIWNDPWLPRGTTRRVSTVQGLVILNQVSELINLITNQWDDELVRWLFHEDDAAVILVIPI